jgi:hypothetical protein
MDSVADAVSRIKGNLEQILPDAVLDPLTWSLGLSGRLHSDAGPDQIHRCLAFVETCDEPVPDLIMNPPRPGRYEPRVVELRPKPHKLMTKPRCELKKPLETITNDPHATAFGSG